MLGNFSPEATLERMRRQGVRSIVVRLQEGACAACAVASEGGRHPIGFAPRLPVRGCRRPPCRCRYVAAKV